MSIAVQQENYYRASLLRPAVRSPLTESVRADVCIVGAGFTGLSAALHLARAGARVVVLEAETIGYAASGRNGGQIHTGLRQPQAELERWLGKDHARDLWRLSEEAKVLIRELVAQYEIDCALKDGLVIAADDRATARRLSEETAHLNSQYGYAAARMMEADETARALGTGIYPAARFDAGGGHLQPLAFARGIARAAEGAGAQLYEFSRARELDTAGRRMRVVCESATVDSDWVILACDAFTGNLVPQLAPYIAHVESFITATEPLSGDLYAQILPCDAAVTDTRHVLDYYRKSADKRMLFAGRESYLSIPGNIAALVRPRMEHVYPALKTVRIDYAWSGTVGITRTRMPHFGRLYDRILFAHGYSGQGVALATLGGKLLAEAAIGRLERFEVFAHVPAKRFPGNAWLRRWLAAAALYWFKLVDYF